MSGDLQAQGQLSPADAPARGWRWAARVLTPILLLGVIFASPLYYVWIRWNNPEDYYSHGPLIPFICAYLVLRKRKELTGEDPPDNSALYAGGIGAAVLYFVFQDLGWDKRWLFTLLCGATVLYVVHSLRALKPQPWKPGLLVLIPSLLFCVIAGTHEIVSVGWFFAVMVVIGLVLYYLGWRVAWKLAFPLLFLLSSVPLPEFLIQKVTLPLKQLATKNTVVILRSPVVGIYCEQDGTKIEFPTDPGQKPKEVTVGAQCSGLRSLIALISFGFLFAYITPLSAVGKTILFLASVPASFIANLIRIIALALITYRWDAATATGDGLWKRMESGALSSLVPQLKSISNEPVHDFTGIMIFVIAFIGLFSLERVLLRIEDWWRRRHAAAEPPAPGPEEAASV